MMKIPGLKRQHMSAFPLIIMSAVGLSIWLWPVSGPDTKEFADTVRPPVAEAGIPVPVTVLSVAQGQPVGDEAHFRGFRLNSGWSVASVGDYGRYGLVADVTNEMDVPDRARLLVTIRVGERNAMMICSANVDPGETKALACSETERPQFTSRWSRITISAF